LDLHIFSLHENIWNKLTTQIWGLAA